MLSTFPPSIFRPTAQASLRFLLAASLGVLSSGYAAQAFAQDSDAPDFSMGDVGLDTQGADAIQSPTRITFAQEASYKVKDPGTVVKNRSSLQVEYAKHVLDNFYVQFNGKATAFLGSDHRREAEETDTRVASAYIQGSFGQTSFRAGVQALPWGESIMAPITDEVSPRDNRELFNFNLEELRVGQGMFVVDHYSTAGRWSAFWNPKPSFNKYPERGTAYFFDPFTYRGAREGDNGTEYGVSWRKNFESSDITLMAASLIDNDYALRMNADGTVSRVKERFSMAGVVFTRAIKNFVIRGEAALKTPKAYNDASLQIVKKDAIDVYLGVDYRYSSSLTFSVEAVNQHISGWNDRIAGSPRDRQSVLLTMTKTLMNDDLTINLLNFYNRPYRSNLTILQTSLKWDDHLTFGLNAVYPHANDRRNGLWNVRDQKQISLKVQYSF